MLSFTHDSKRQSNPYMLDYPEQYQPITITNGGNGKVMQMPNPINSKKKIVKTHSGSQNNRQKSISRTQKPSASVSASVKQIQNKPWNAQITTQKVGLFDKNIKKDSLAAQDRQIRAQSRIKQNQKIKNKQQGDNKVNKIINKQEELHHKKLNVLAEQQERQIQKLKALIQKQRLEKQRNDMEYQAKKRKIQQERRQLIQLERQIQKQGPKITKQVKQKLKTIEPVQDKVRLKQKLDQRDPRSRTNQNFYQITQSESLANQKNKIRQQQLQYLVHQREQNHKQYQRNTLGYTPTIIPLLSKASYKIVSTHVSSLVELLVDQLLEQQVYLLQAIQLEGKAEQAKNREKEMLQDYAHKLEQFVDQNQRIQDKIGRYNTLTFTDQHYKPAYTPHQPQSAFTYQPQLYTKLQLKLNSSQLQQIQHRIDRYRRYVSNFDQYKPNNLDMFRKVTQEIIDQAVLKLAKQLDNGAGEFVNVVFRGEFD